MMIIYQNNHDEDHIAERMTNKRKNFCPMADISNHKNGPGRTVWGLDVHCYDCIDVTFRIATV